MSYRPTYQGQLKCILPTLFIVHLYCMTSFFKHNKLLHNFSVWVQKIGAFVKALVLGFFLLGLNLSQEEILLK